MEDLNNAVAFLNALSDSFCSNLVRRISTTSLRSWILTPRPGFELDLTRSTGMDLHQGMSLHEGPCDALRTKHPRSY